MEQARCMAILTSHVTRKIARATKGENPYDFIMNLKNISHVTGTLFT